MRLYNLLCCVLVVGGLLCLVAETDGQRRNRNRNRNRNRSGSRNRNRNSNSNTDNSDNFDANNELEKFGYLDDTRPGHSHSEDTIAKALREFQRFNGLSVTGFLDQNTVQKMQQPRCGIPDVIKPGERPLQLNDEDGTQAPLAYHAPGYKWDNTTVTWKVERFTTQLPQGNQLQSFINAFQKWNEVTPLEFQRTNGNADILIKFASGEHGDGAGNAFDGRSGTLAHAFFPGRAPISGDTHFDDSELWTLGENRGSNLEIVAAHEFGHALGLGHSSYPTALMAPYYQGYDPNFALHSDDIRGIQTLYGSGGRRPATRRPQVTRTPVTRRPTVTQRPTGRHCNLRFHAIEQIHDGRILGFKGNKVYVITRNGAVNETRTRSIFPRAPNNPGGVVYDRYGRYLYFFKGRKYWKYRGFTKMPGYPKNLPADFQRIQAAMQWKDGGMYLFKGNKYTRWVERLTSYPSGYPRNTRSYWSNFPKNIDAAYRSYDGYYYVFKFFRYWRYNTRAGISPGYPRNTREVWLNCGGTATGRRQSQRMITKSFLTAEINEDETED